MCEREGLTLEQASERHRLYRETFYVCRNCGKDGETIEKRTIKESTTHAVGGAMKWGWGSAVVIVPLLIWMQWWNGVVVIGTTLLASPGICWWENRKAAKALAARGFPRAGAPGGFPIPEPTVGCLDETVIGQPLPPNAGELRATGPCCDKPDWIEASSVKDEHRVPCPTCGHGTMVVSDHAIH
jgi:hypothetical protein